jgi:single-stranded-DNA-specific exonuclease
MQGGPIQGRRKRWRVVDPPSPDDLSALDGIPPLVAHLLARRGIITIEDAKEFLEVDPVLFEDPRNLPEIALAVERLEGARENRETVAVFGDFDADGVTGTALMMRALTRYGFQPIPYIPHRVSEGHGLNTGAVDTLKDQGVTLIVTVDCGVTDVGPIAHAKGSHIDTIVTDHHLVTGARPDAIAIINPKAPGSNYAFHHLTGVGMALKLSQALLEPTHPTDWADGLMELAAIGTITDMAPLVDENRYIVSAGLEQLRSTKSTGIRTLLESARIHPTEAGAETIGFTIGPRLNAAGRLDHAYTAYRLLMTDDPAEATSLAKKLQEINTERQQLTEETLQLCRQQMEELGGSSAVVLLGSEEFNPGVVGLVAGKIVEEFGSPAAVYSLLGDTVMASCRSAPGFHWTDALIACSDLLYRFGGHAQAAGFSCNVDKLPELHQRLLAIAAERWHGPANVLEGVADAEVELPTLMGQTFQTLRRMEPFGVGNPEPVFVTRDVQVTEARTMGTDGQHFRLKLRAGGATWEAVAFRQEWVPNTKRAHIVYTMNVDHWNGRQRLRLTLLDYAPVED